MITVSISINAQPIFARTAVNVTTDLATSVSSYMLDTGETITHKRGDGAVQLAIKMLRTIKEVGVCTL